MGLKKKWVLTVLTVFFAAVFAASAFFLARYLIESATEEQAYAQLSDIMSEAMETLPTTPAGDPEDTDPWVTVTDPETGETVALLPEFLQLYTMNRHIVGWIQIPGTRIDYPVMQTPAQEDYYLKRNFDRKYADSGCIYAEEFCDVFAPSDNVTLYGHMMKSGSMFGALRGYKKKSFWQEHPTVVFNTLRERHEYEIFAVFLTTASQGQGFRYNLFSHAADQAEFDDFVSTCRGLSLYDTGIVPEYGDKFLTLSTCEYSQVNGRLVVVARRVD